MKFSCTQENLNRGVSFVSHIASRNTNLPILQNILINATESGIELVATNLQMGIRVHVRGKVEQPGSFTVPAQVFASYVGLLSAERVDIELGEDAALRVKAGNQQTKINGVAASEFPLLPDVQDKRTIALPVSELREALQQTLIATSKDADRPALTAVYVAAKDQEVVFAATDSHRLSERRIRLTAAVPVEWSVLVPQGALSELVRVLPTDDDVDVVMTVSDSQVLFSVADVQLNTERIEGRFPDYTQIIPTEYNTTAIVQRDDLVKAVKAASLFSKSGIHDVSLKFSPEEQQVTLTAVNNQVGENVTRVISEITGNESNPIFNYRYLLDGLSNIKTAKVTVKLVDGMTAVLFQPQGESDTLFTYVIMPIKQ